MDSEEYATSTEYVGFPVGYTDNNGASYYINNHVNIIINYHTVEDDGYRIVGFYVEPISIKHSFSSSSAWDGKGKAPALSTCSTSNRLEYKNVKTHQKVVSGPLIYTYGVEFKKSDVSIKTHRFLMHNEISHN
jgi:transmembrane 9 superfamily protein 2/4